MTPNKTRASQIVDSSKQKTDLDATSPRYGDGMLHPDPPATHVVVVGAGMVAHRFVESLLSRAGADWRVTLIGEEGRAPYDRVGLTSFFGGATPDELTLDRGIIEDDPRIRFLPGDPVTRLEQAERRVVTASGQVVPYDHLVLATGSFAAKLKVDGFGHRGCFVYRTLDDVEALRTYVSGRASELGRPLTGMVIGGGLLGLEAAGALQNLGVNSTVVQSSDRLMSAQLDLPAGNALRRLIESRGIGVRTGSVTTRLDADKAGRVVGFEGLDHRGGRQRRHSDRPCG